jgi:hypothetical protein
MQLTLLHGYPDMIGRRFDWCGYGNGPASYVAAGDPLDPLPTGFSNHIDNINPAMTVSGNYIVYGKPSAGGPRADWVLIWTQAGTPVVAGTDLSQEVVQLSGLGGKY